MLRFCVCCIRKEFQRLLDVLKKDLKVAHENHNCTCGCCINGQCKVVFESDMDLYWCMHLLLCAPSNLYSHTPRDGTFIVPSFQSPFKLFRIPSVCSCLDSHCAVDSPCFFSRTQSLHSTPKNRKSLQNNV